MICQEIAFGNIWLLLLTKNKVEPLVSAEVLHASSRPTLDLVVTVSTVEDPLPM